MITAEQLSGYVNIITKYELNSIDSKIRIGERSPKGFAALMLRMGNIKLGNEAETRAEIIKQCQEIIDLVSK